MARSRIPRPICISKRFFRFYLLTSRIFYLCLGIGFVILPGWAEPWWSSLKIEETRTVEEGITYDRVLYQKHSGNSARVHILSVTDIGSRYIFGILGTYGILLPPSDFAKQSDALVVINGSFFSKKPTRSLGLVAAHNRILYPPNADGNFRGTVGFTPTDVLFDWIGMEDINGNRFQTNKEGWNDCHSALGAGPILVHTGQIRMATELEGFNLEQTAPRTAIGKSRDGHVLVVVVDGRQSDWSEGVTLPELAELFRARDAMEALNLDGGGSSTLVVKNQIVNRPSDFAIPSQPGRERPVANVIALFKK